MEEVDQGQVETGGLDPFEERISTLCEQYVAGGKQDDVARQIARLVIEAQRANRYIPSCHYFSHACFSIGDRARDTSRFVEIFMEELRAEAEEEESPVVDSSCTAFAEEVRAAAEEEESIS